MNDRFLILTDQVQGIAILALVLVLTVAVSPLAAQSQMRWAVHISLASTWLDPAEHTGIVTLPIRAGQ